MGLLEKQLKASLEVAKLRTRRDELLRRADKHWQMSVKLNRQALDAVARIEAIRRVYSQAGSIEERSDVTPKG